MQLVLLIMLLLDYLLLQIVAINCLTPPSEPNGSHKFLTFVEAFYSSSVLYECDHGYWYDYGVYNMTLTCDSEGDWFPPYSSCKG